jgi:hypothetical protein
MIFLFSSVQLVSLHRNINTKSFGGEKFEEHTAASSFFLPFQYPDQYKVFLDEISQRIRIRSRRSPPLTAVFPDAFHAGSPRTQLHRREKLSPKWRSGSSRDTLSYFPFSTLSHFLPMEKNSCRFF